MGGWGMGWGMGRRHIFGEGVMGSGGEGGGERMSGVATVLAVDWPKGIKVGSSGAANWLLSAAHRSVI